MAESCERSTGFFENPTQCGLATLKTPTAIISILFLVPIVYFLVYKLLKCLCKCVWKIFTVEVTVSASRLWSAGEDELYHKLLKWLTTQLPEVTQTTSISRTEHMGFNKYAPVLTSPPAFGVHYFKYEGQWIRLYRGQTPRTMSQGTSCEFITFTVWRGSGQRQFLEAILLDAVKVPPENDDEKKIVMHNISACGYQWEQTGEPKRRRLLSSVILAEGVTERVISDVHDFINRKEWYIEREIPHRRGYLFYGPPGCGKTSFVKAIAGEIDYSICVLSLSAKGLTDENLMKLMEYAPENSIILLEDIDAAFKSRENKNATMTETNLAFEGNAPSSVTFRGLLNALDGIASTEGRIICMTTNYLGRLDPALIRAGRVDQKVLIDFPKDQQLRRLFGRFYADVTEEMKDRFVSAIRDLNKDITMAMVQGLFVLHKDDPEEALANLKEYFDEEFLIVESSDVEGVNSSH
jgi:chaperone BCS1